MILFTFIRFCLASEKEELMQLLSWFFDFPVSTAVLIIATIVLALSATITFAKGLWKF